MKLTIPELLHLKRLTVQITAIKVHTSQRTLNGTKMYVFSNELREDSHKTVGVFSSHWAAVAAMLRLTDPAFKSLGGDKKEDLAIEATMQCSLTTAN